MSLTVKELFSTTGDEAFFVEPGGNWGDSMIYVGAECLAEKSGLRYLNISRKSFFERKDDLPPIIYMHGGGALHKWGLDHSWRLLEKIISSPVRHAIIGPQTLENDRDFVAAKLAKILEKRKCEKITFFTREVVSYSLMKQLDIPGIELCLDEDTAFHIDLDKYISASEIKEKYDLYVVRRDLEKSSAMPKHIPKDAVVTDPVESAKSFTHWLRIHAHSKRVVANRTHSTIVSALMGKDTTMYDGSYHKNASIYEQSLRPRGVKWLSPEEMTDKRKLRYSWPMPREIFPGIVSESYKVKCLYRELIEMSNHFRGMPRC